MGPGKVPGRRRATYCHAGRGGCPPRLPGAHGRGAGGWRPPQATLPAVPARRRRGRSEAGGTGTLPSPARPSLPSSARSSLPSPFDSSGGNALRRLSSPFPRRRLPGRDPPRTAQLRGRGEGRGRGAGRRRRGGAGERRTGAEGRVPGPAGGGAGVPAPRGRSGGWVPAPRARPGPGRWVPAPGGRGGGSRFPGAGAVGPGGRGGGSRLPGPGAVGPEGRGGGSRLLEPSRGALRRRRARLGSAPPARRGSAAACGVRGAVEPGTEGRQGQERGEKPAGKES